MINSNSPEFRTDVLTGLRVLIAPVRSSRPSAMHPEPPLFRTDDPFAEGNETDTPGERFAVRNPDSAANGPGWQLRVVPNRYPAVISEARDTRIVGSSLFPAQSASGEHDVVIECPDSRTRLAELSLDEVQTVLRAWRTRVQQLVAAERYSTLAVFRNEGFSAGASLAHCHSQIIASEELMPLDKERSARAALHRAHTGRELVADLLQAERSDGSRMICETAHFAVLCPFASRTSWHIRFLPILQQPCTFAVASDECLTELALLLNQQLNQLEHVLGGPFSFNLTLPHPRLDQPPQFRWMLDLLPRTGRHAGWEYLTSVDIITVAPEQAAKMLRS